MAAENNRPAGDSFGRRVLAEWPILVVLAGFAFGLTVILHDEVFQGAAILGLSILLAAGLRLFLPTRMAGTLAIRRRGVNVCMYTILGTALVILGLLVQGIFSNNGAAGAVPESRSGRLAIPVGGHVS